MEYINATLKSKIQNLVKVIKQFLEKLYLRDDCKELLELSLMYLGEETDVILYRPGACHHARWMAKTVYSLKVVLLRNYLDIIILYKLSCNLKFKNGHRERNLLLIFTLGFG